MRSSSGSYFERPSALATPGLAATYAPRRMDLIVIDANVLCADFWLKSAPIVALLDQSRHGVRIVVVPEAVVREVVGSFRRSVLEAKAELLRTQRKLQRQGIALGLDIENWAIKELSNVAAYDRWLRRALAEADVTMLDHKEDALLRLVDRAIDRLAPFNADGHGFRDAMVWETVLYFLEPGPVVLLSNDNVFANGKGSLSEALRNEVVALTGDPDRVELVRSAHAYVLKFADDPRAHADVAALLRAETAQIRGNIEQALIGSTAELIGGQGWASVAEADVGHVALLRTSRIEGGDGSLLVVLSAECRVDLDVDVYDPLENTFIQGRHSVRDDVEFTAVYSGSHLDNFAANDPFSVAVSNGQLY